MVPTGLSAQAPNDAFDAKENRLTAFLNCAPNVVLRALYGIAALGIGYVGSASGIEKRRWRLPVFTMNALAAFVIPLIRDIDQPARGFIVVSQQPIDRRHREFDCGLPRRLQQCGATMMTQTQSFPCGAVSSQERRASC